MRPAAARSRLTDLMLELVDTFTADKGVTIPRPLVRMAVQFLRMAIRRRAKFDIHELDVIAAARSSFVPALFGHATGDKFILPHHTEDIFAIYPARTRAGGPTPTHPAAAAAAAAAADGARGDAGARGRRATRTSSSSRAVTTRSDHSFSSTACPSFS